MIVAAVAAAGYLQYGAREIPAAAIWKPTPIAVPAPLKPVDPVDPEAITIVHKGCNIGKEPIIEAKLCDVVNNMQSYDGKCVRITAEVRTDCFETRLVLIDGLCGSGLIPWSPPDGLRDRLSIGICEGEDLDMWLHSRVTGRFTGRVVWNRKARRHARLLDLCSIKNLYYEPSSGSGSAASLTGKDWNADPLLR